MQRVEFKRPEGILLAVMGVLFILAACAGVVMAVLIGQDFDVETVTLIVLGFLGACALGVGFIHAWRTPMLTIQPDALTVPTFFGAREIPIGPGHPVGEFLASSDKVSHRSGTIESNKFVFFYTLDARGTLTELVSMHRAAPAVAQIRRALEQVAGLRVEVLEADPNSRKARPDVAHWKTR
ncbi:MAG: hypothetical protein H6825_08325 [Planctomycetes bacterium]|nr:hypothetical protein [Planctomycetota bacterium]